MVLQNYQKLLEITLKMIYIFELGIGFKGPRKIHLNTQCPPPLHSQAFRHPDQVHSNEV